MGCGWVHGFCLKRSPKGVKGASNLKNFLFGEMLLRSYPSDAAPLFVWSLFKTDEAWTASTKTQQGNCAPRMGTCPSCRMSTTWSRPRRTYWRTCDTQLPTYQKHQKHDGTWGLRLKLCVFDMASLRSPQLMQMIQRPQRCRCPIILLWGEPHRISQEDHNPAHAPNLRWANI